MSAPAKVLELVERFNRNLEAYKQGKYGEAEIRLEFIDPFFKALGWDVYNEKGYASAYKDVVPEDAIKVGGATKAPDYSFRIGGTRKFFVEAKKPSVNLKDDISPAFQLRRYAWSAKLPLSILTDFEEFAVYDCQSKPARTDKASTARVMYFEYHQYTDHWEEIASVFSREAVLAGSFDKYVDSTKRKKGTAPVDKSFLQEIEAWRELLARNIALRNLALTQRELNFAIQRTIDRMVFLRICEDRGIEPYGKLMALQNGTEVYQRLLTLFRQADDRYNSGLFHFKPEQGRPDTSIDTLTPNLEIDDKALKEILKNLYYPDSPYEFSVLPADILGQVYEQFLGKVIRLTPAHRAKVEDKPEVKKAGGVYYTPTYIVDYIVKQTVGKLVKGKKADPRGAISKLRILDPACGSGSFLIGAYQYLVDWHLEQYANDDPEKHARGRPPRLRQGRDGEWKLTLDEKKRILLDNIYGVDTDAQAVEVTKLSLLLKVLEGESEGSMHQLEMFAARALPDLGDNIKCGNSLIGPDFYETQQMDLLDEEEKYRINVFDWQAEFPEIIRAGGFDAVIGNPPYVLVSNDIFSNFEIEYLSSYEVAYYKVDLFHLFIQRGLELLRSGGLFGYIVPNPWLTLKFSKKLRHYILMESKINEIVVLDHLVFKNADVYTMLVFLERGIPNSKHSVEIRKPKSATDLETIITTPIIRSLQSRWQQNEGFRFETRLIGKIGKLVLKVVNRCKSLSDIARASLGCQAYNRSKHTPEQIKNRVFHASNKVGDEYLPELAGSDIGRYSVDRKRGEWIRYGPWLHDFRTMDWLQGPRILIREIPGSSPYRIQACYVEETYCNYKTILNVNPDKQTNISMKYLCGILNSRLLSFIYPYRSDKILTRSFPRLTVGDLRNLPIRTIDFSDPADVAHHDRMVSLVERMLEMHKQSPGAKTPHEKTTLQRQVETTDRQIDNLVYELYDLTEEEIRIVEEGV